MREVFPEIIQQKCQIAQHIYASSKSKKLFVIRLRTQVQNRWLRIQCLSQSTLSLDKEMFEMILILLATSANPIFCHQPDSTRE